jgi:hypothetical protein
VSALLSQRQLTAIERIGDIMLPGGEGFPSFSQTGCITHIDPLLEVTPAEDVTGLKILLTVLSFLPSLLLVGFLRLVEKDERLPAFLGSVFRNIDLGLKGLVMSTYYSNRTGHGYAGPRVHDVIDFELRVVKP